MESDEGYDVAVIGKAADDMFCIICLKLIRDAVQMHCGHGMCQKCFDKMVNYADARSVPINCPSCRATVDEEKVIPVPMLDRVILSLQVKCINLELGCDWTGELGDLHVHLRTTCKFKEEEEGTVAQASSVLNNIPSIKPKDKSNGTDICGTSGKVYIVRPDVGTYLRSTNLNEATDLVTYSLHKNCYGEHYLTTSGKFYIIQGDHYRRVTNMNQDESAVTYTLHENCQKGDLYFCTGSLFAIVFLKTKTCHLTSNMNKDWDAEDVALPEDMIDGVYHWGLGKKHYCMKQSGWQLEYHRYSSFQSTKEDNYEFHSTVVKFLPGGLGLVHGTSRRTWKCIYYEKNSGTESSSFTRRITRKHGVNIDNDARLNVFDSDLRVKLIRSQFLYDFAENEKLSVYLMEENWDPLKKVEESVHFKLNPKDEVYVWQYIIEFAHWKNIYFTEFLALTDDNEKPDYHVE